MKSTSINIDRTIGVSLGWEVDKHEEKISNIIPKVIHPEMAGVIHPCSFVFSKPSI